MKPGELDKTLGLMKFQFQLQNGVVPNTVLVPRSRIPLFVAGCVVDMKGDVDARLIRDALERDTGDLVIHDMIVRPSKVVDDLTVCVSA